MRHPSRIAKPGEYLLFSYGEWTEAYRSHGASLEEVATWLPESTKWAIVWAPSRSQARKAAIANWGVGRLSLEHHRKLAS